MRCIKFLLISVVAMIVLACTDDDDSNDYPFDREVMAMNAFTSCGAKDDGSDTCFRVSFNYPFEKEHLEAIYIWLDTTVVDDTTKEISSSQMKKADSVIDLSQVDKNRLREKVSDTIDLTSLVKEYLKKNYVTLQVVLYCDYSKGDNGIAQRLFLQLGDQQKPSLISIRYPSVWTTGATIEWQRPTDQRSFYAPSDLSGPIVGYNVLISAKDKNEDLRKLDFTLEGAADEVITHAHINFVHDSIRVDSSSANEKKDYHLVILDGKGFDLENDSANIFRLTIEGLKIESQYSVSIWSMDSSGNESDESNDVFSTTDSIAPLISTKLFSVEDTLFPGEGYTMLDSNNRVRIFWSRAVDPLVKNHNIEVDSVLTIPATCAESDCYDTVAYYEILRYNSVAGTWDPMDSVGGKSDRYEKSYDWEDDGFEVSSMGSLIVDTLRWVSPGDTVILKIRARDASGYYSLPLIDTIYVSPGALAQEMECPEGYVAVAASDSNKFCMERFEHMDDSGKFVSNVLHAEAKAACEGVSASGFKVGLCKERDWELVCLSGGLLSYGIVEDDIHSVTELLFRYCNVGKTDSAMAADITKRSSLCVNPMGVRDMPGQYQEWVMGRSADSAAVLKGSSYKKFDGLDNETIALCTNRSFPYFTRVAYTEDPVYLYREGTKVDTVYEADTSRTLYKKLTKKDFKDSLQFFDVQDSSGNSIGVDYAPYAEYKNGGDEWLEKVSNGLVYKPSEIKVVFLTGERVQYRKASDFYRSPSIGFRCCAYPE